MTMLQIDRRAFLASLAIVAGSPLLARSKKHKHLAAPGLGQAGAASPADYGTVGEGNDLQALAQSFKANAGGTVTLERGRVYRLGQGKPLVLPAGTTLVTNGASFEVAMTLHGTKTVFTLEQSRIDGDLVMHVLAGARMNRLVTVNGAEIGGRIVLSSDDHQANNNRKNKNNADVSLRNESEGDNAHGALRIRSTGGGGPVKLGDVSVQGFDFAITAIKFGRLELGDVVMRNALRGFKIDGGDEVIHGNVTTSGRSPNGQEGHIPGQNSYLFANVRQVTGGFLDLADNFEHCMRQGGNTGDRRMEKAVFKGVRTLRSGQSGIKLSNSAGDTGTIVLGDVEVTDAGYRQADPAAHPGRNEAGILAEVVDDLQVDSFVLRASDGRQHSCNVGLDLRAVRRCRVGRFDGAATDSHLVSAADQTSLDGTLFTAPLDSLEIDSLIGRDIGGRWLELDYAKADIGTVSVSGRCDGCGGPLVRLDSQDPAGSGGVTGDVRISVAGAPAGALADIRSASPRIKVTPAG